MFSDNYFRRAVDRVAAWVSGPGEHFVSNTKVLTNDSETPIACRPFNKSELSQPGHIDLRGKTFGRFTVLGVGRDMRGQWVVRCACGMYSTRSAKAIKNPENVQDRCEQCRHVAFLKREEVWRRTGVDQDIRRF